MANQKTNLSESLAALKSFERNLSDVKNPAQVFSEILRRTNRLFAFPKSFIALYNERAERLRIAATEGFSATEFRRFEKRFDEGAFQKIINRAQSNGGFFDGGDSAFSSELIFEDERAIESFVSVPIRIKNKVVGIVCCFSRANARQDAADVENFLAIVAGMIAQTVGAERAASGEREKLLAENLELRRELKEKYEFSHIVGSSSEMRRVCDQAAQVARSNAAVLLRGESGTGKELIAGAIHYNSLRSKKNFVKINCHALPETLIESELFGYERGALPGAQQRRKGRFELAEGGTLFLDEIGGLSAPTQVKLLRVLQEREFERLGGTETIKTNVRLIAATNKNLEAAVADGSFREDLYYRLNVFTIFLPPLRERKSDILLLAESFIEKYERAHGKNIKRISTPAIDMLSSYHFPGNVRELENAIERAVLVCDGSVIHGHHLPTTLQTADVTGTVTQVSLTAAVEAFERGLIQDALKTTGGNHAKAARLLDTTERILCYKIGKYKIEPRRFKN